MRRPNAAIVFSKAFILSALLATALGSVVPPRPASEPALAAQACNATDETRNMIYLTSESKTFKNGSVSDDHISILSLIQNPTDLTHVVLFNFNITPNGTVLFQRHRPDDGYFDWLFQETKQLQSKGIKLLGSLGGAGNTVWDRLEKNFAGLYPPLCQTIRNLSLDGLDLDIETPTTQNATLRLLRQLDADFGPNFILTLAPVQQALHIGPTANSGLLNYTQLDAAAAAPAKPHGRLINWYNVQFYAGGTTTTPVAVYQSTVKKGFDPARIVYGLTAYNIDGSWKTIAQYQAVIRKIKAQFPSFAGVVGWEYFDAGLNDQEINRDRKNRWKWVQAMGRAVFGNVES